MIVTREWIFAHRTERGAWTREQIEALGIKWPPRIGWIDRLDGTQITDAAAWDFEMGQFIAAKDARALKRGIPLSTEVRAKIQAMKAHKGSPMPDAIRAQLRAMRA